MRTHWRNPVARYGAYPIVWCVAGEGVMPYYLSPAWSDKEKREEYASKLGYSRKPSPLFVSIIRNILFLE
jgi:hypothetical protein